MSTPPRCRTRCWSARTAPISTRCRAWSTTSISASPMSSAARTMSPTPRRRSSSSRRSAPRRRPSAITICWSAPDGQALSKRDRSLSISGMREEGIEPLAVASYAATIGTSDPVAPHASLDELVRGFRLREIVARAGAVRSARASRCSTPSCCMRFLTRRWRARLARDGHRRRRAISGRRCAAISPCSPMRNVWWRVVDGPLEPVIADAALCQRGGGAAAAGAVGRRDLERLVSRR